jgi:cellulose synthase (UDP-forming)
MFAIRLWGANRLFRGHLHWRMAFALRVLRVPVGISCLWWLITRRDLQFQVTPKAGADERVRGRIPGVLWGLFAIIVIVLLYALVGLTGIVPWYSSPASTAASGVWLLMAALVLIISIWRVQAAAYATSRRNAHRVPLRAPVTVNGLEGRLVDISVGGAAVRLPSGSLVEAGPVDLALPGAGPIRMETVRIRGGSDDTEIASLRVLAGDWAAYWTMSLWLFHTPPGVVAGLPLHAPAVAATRRFRRSSRNVLKRQHG